MGTTLHLREWGGGEAYGVYDDVGGLVATVRRNATSTDDFELELDRPRGETIRRWISSSEALGYERALRVEELVQQYFPDDRVELDAAESAHEWSALH